MWMKPPVIELLLKIKAKTAANKAIANKTRIMIGSSQTATALPVEKLLAAFIASVSG